MAVRDDDGFHLRCGNGQWREIEGFDVARALVEPAIDEKMMTIDRDQMFASGYGTGRADKR
jgi:hypothetical protein